PIVVGPPMRRIDDDPPVGYPMPWLPGDGPGSGFRVDPMVLRKVGEHARAIAEELGQTVRGQAGVLGDAGPHGGWAVGGALSRCAEAWERELVDTVGKVRSVGDKMGETAAQYSHVDSVGRDRLDGLSRR